jgi:RHS repeat-associated protein
MLNDGINTLTYDAENCLLSNTNSSTGTTNYTCDATGVRVKKALQGGATTVYIFDGDLDIAEYNNGAAPGSPSREFLYAGSDLVASITGSNTIYHHKDHLSVRLYTDGTPGSPTYGQVTAQQATYPYGESWYSTGAGAPDQFVFTSYQRDSESGNDYAMARYYIDRFGRFCSADPLMGDPGDPQSWNRYAYVRNDPINMTDPSGQSWLTTLLSVLIDIFSAVTFQPEGIALGQSIGQAIEGALLEEVFLQARQNIREAREQGQQGGTFPPPPPPIKPPGADVPGSYDSYTICNNVSVLATFVGPRQAPRGRMGTAAINRSNFGLKSSRVLKDPNGVFVKPDWSTARPVAKDDPFQILKPRPGAPGIPNGLPDSAKDSIPATDNIGGSQYGDIVQVDIYRMSKTRDANKSTRRVNMDVWLPKRYGGHCPH